MTFKVTAFLVFASLTCFTLGCQSEPKRRPITNSKPNPAADAVCAKTPDAEVCKPAKTAAEIEAERVAKQKEALLVTAKECKAKNYPAPDCNTPKADKVDDQACMETNWSTDDCRIPPVAETAKVEPPKPVAETAKVEPPKPFEAKATAPSIVEANKIMELKVSAPNADGDGGRVYVMPAGINTGAPMCTLNTGDVLKVKSAKVLVMNSARYFIEIEKTPLCPNITEATITKDGWDGWP